MICQIFDFIFVIYYNTLYNILCGKSYKITLILGTLHALMPNVSASDINVSINQSQKEGN